MSAPYMDPGDDDGDDDDDDDDHDAFNQATDTGGRFRNLGQNGCIEPTLSECFTK